MTQQLHPWTFSRVMKSYVHTKISLFSMQNVYANVHKSFICNSQNWKEPRCPPIGEWLNKLYYISWNTIL